jgi:hypothetical protein
MYVHNDVNVTEAGRRIVSIWTAVVIMTATVIKTLTTKRTRAIFRMGRGISELILAVVFFVSGTVILGDHIATLALLRSVIAKTAVLIFSVLVIASADHLTACILVKRHTLGFPIHLALVVFVRYIQSLIKIR